MSLSEATLGKERNSALLFSILFLGVALRLASALIQGDSVNALPGIYDQISYDMLARQVLAGHGFTFPVDWWPATRAGEPTAQWSYLYTVYLTVVYAILGPHPLAARLIQALVAGLLYPWLTWRIGRRIFGREVGLIAGALTALYAYFVYYAGALMTETFYILAILWMFDLVTAVSWKSRVTPSGTSASSSDALKSAKPWLLLGVALGITVLLRQVYLLFVPFLFAWILWSRTRKGAAGQQQVRSGRFRRAVIGVFGSALVMLSMILPWTVHNYQSFGRFVLLNTNAGSAFFWANHPIHGTDFQAILPADVYGDLIPPELRTLDEAALDQALLQRGIRFVLDDPVRYVLLSLNRVKDYFSFLPSAESGPMSSLARAASFGVLLPFVVLGLLLATIRRRRYIQADRGSHILLLCAFVVIYSLIHLLSWALIRYRLPVDAVLIIFAALAIKELAVGLARGRLAASWLSWSSAKKELDSERSRFAVSPVGRLLAVLRARGGRKEYPCR